MGHVIPLAWLVVMLRVIAFANWTIAFFPSIELFRGVDNESSVFGSIRSAILLIQYDCPPKHPESEFLTMFKISDKSSQKRQYVKHGERERD
jgi:hypothetical protein